MKNKWPFLESLSLPYIDLALANYLQAPDEATAALICHLSLAARAGHLCIDQEAPSVAELWDVPPEAHFQIEQLIRQGHSDQLIRDGSLIYLPRYWKQETDVLNAFRQLKNTPPKIPITLPDHKHPLLPEQAEAILKASQQSVTLICGGPGTGKTYTAGILLQLFPACEVALAAPTGKAAANLQKNMPSGLPPVKTLHSLLGIKRTYKEPVKLTADLILVDECSMIDVQLMGYLLSAIKPGARLILLGDPHQLPAVEAGSLFADMIAAAPDCVATLHTCMRTELQEIVTFSQKINAGDDAAVLQMLNSGSAVTRFTGDPLDPLDDLRLLSPLRKGPYGVDQINRTLYNRLMAKKTGPVALPIMLTRNDSRLELFNGETGTLILHGDTVQEGDYALFASRRVPALLLPPYEYAFALSVHKSQGSEFDHVLLLLPEGSQHFGREVLYTAATRARKSLQIHASDAILQATIQTTGKRLSGFTKRYTSWT